MRRADSGFKIFPRTATREEVAAMEELAPGGEIDGAAAALLIGSKWAAFVWPLVPANSEPAKIFESSISVGGPAAIGIEVFHAHDERTAGSTRALIGGPEGTRVAHVEISGRRRREAAAVTRDR
jgi:hypothetical protein